jgi:UDPglucose 6-dehydrogenase
MAVVCVVGAGYVGLVTAVCLAKLGHSVICLEVDKQRLACLRGGRSPICEPGIESALRRQVKLGRLCFTDSYREGIGAASFVIIAVQTPAGPRGETDTSFVEEAVDAARPHLRAGAVLVIKSTVPPGTADALAAAMAPLQVEVVSNPEFLRQGCAIEDSLHPDRIVIGAGSDSAARAVRRLYAGIDAPVLVCSRRSAEIAKYAANAFLAARISLVNEIAGLCEATGAEIDQVSAIVGADRRVGPSFLAPGLGWGGSCFPKDVTALIDTADRYGCRHDMLDAVYRVNINQREIAARHLASAADGRRDGCVAVLGLAFKPGTGDVRGSPALEITARLLEGGLKIKAHDPVAIDEARRVLPNIRYERDAYAAVEGSDAVLLATEWEEYLALDWRRVRSLMRGETVIDGRNALDPHLLKQAGFRYIGFGRPAQPSRPMSYGAAAARRARSRVLAKEASR